MITNDKNEVKIFWLNSLLNLVKAEDELTEELVKELIDHHYQQTANKELIEPIYEDIKFHSTNCVHRSKHFEYDKPAERIKQCWIHQIELQLLYCVELNRLIELKLMFVNYCKQHVSIGSYYRMYQLAESFQNSAVYWHHDCIDDKLTDSKLLKEAIAVVMDEYVKVVAMLNRQQATIDDDDAKFNRAHRNEIIRRYNDETALIELHTEYTNELSERPYVPKE